MLIFGWDKKEKLKDLYQRLFEYADEDLLETTSNYILKMDAPIEETIDRFKASATTFANHTSTMIYKNRVYHSFMVG